jgi:hypothetical protein
MKPSAALRAREKTAEPRKHQTKCDLRYSVFRFPTQLLTTNSYPPVRFPGKAVISYMTQLSTEKEMTKKRKEEQM